MKQKVLKNIFNILSILVLIAIVIIIYFINMNKINGNDIPIVVISWNSLTFLKNFVNQIKELPNPIIILDNKSDYEPLLEYYKEIKKELNNKINIRLLDKNYGHNVYLELKNTLPSIFILSDPDLKFNSEMPKNVGEIFLEISNKYKAYKVGSALDLSDKEKFLQCSNYTNGKNIFDWESKFWKKKINDNDYEMYYADIDTTFTLCNNNYINNNIQIRVAGKFLVKHLPWYNNYIEENIPSDELSVWLQNNKSSSILRNCKKF